MMCFLFGFERFVKQYRAHLSPIIAIAVSADGLMAATIAADSAKGGSVKIFDVPNFGMFIIQREYTIGFLPKN